MTIVSFSEIAKYQECEMEYYFQFGLGLTSNNHGTAINIGNYGHLVMEKFYRALKAGKSKEQAIEAMGEPEEGFNSQWGRAYAVALKYIHSMDRKGAPLSIEERFIAPVSSSLDLKIGFTPDLVWQKDGSGVIEVEDYKFIGRMWSDNKLSRYEQLNLYILFLRELGWDIKRAQLRLFNHSTLKIRTKVYEPSEEHLNSLRRNFIREAVKIMNFKTTPVKEQKDVASRTFNYMVCDRCKFVYPCNLLRDGKDVTKTLANMYTENKYGYEK